MHAHDHPLPDERDDQQQQHAEPVRTGLIRTVRAHIQTGGYDSEHRLEIAVERMIERLADAMSGQKKLQQDRAA